MNSIIMITKNERVRIRTEDKSVKLWGRVIDMTMTTEPTEVTCGPDEVELGQRPDVTRRFVPGSTSIRLVIEVEL
jgi:hypothetical protein